MDTWNAPTVQSRQPLIYRLMEGVRLGGPRLTWNQLTERDRREWKLSAINPHDSDTWRSGVNSAMRAASQLPGRGAHCCGYGPCTCTLIKNPMLLMMMMMLLLHYSIFWDEVKNKVSYHADVLVLELMSKTKKKYIYFMIFNFCVFKIL